MPMSKRLGAEFIGTFWLVLGGCGGAVLAAAFPGLGIGFLGVALAFGLTVLTMAFAIGHISGCHLNPAVSVGLVVGGRFPASELLPYIVVQVLGAIAGAAVLYIIASGHAGFDAGAGFASNGYGEHSPGGYSLLACLVDEVVMTFMFLMIILGATDERAPKGFAPDRHRAGPDADPPDQHSGHQYLGQSGALDRPGDFCRRLGAWPALAVLGRADPGRGDCRGGLSLARQKELAPRVTSPANIEPAFADERRARDGIDGLRGGD